MTGLRWERTPTFIASPPDAEASSFARALSYCGSLVVNANSSFRVPSMNELQTLVDETNPDFAIDRIAFPETRAAGYWTTSIVANDAKSAWFVSFATGYSQSAALTTPNLVRCVRVDD
jgi:hypothetical protein